MGERGKVVEVKGDYLTVKLQRTEACAKCRACIAGMSTEEMIINAKNFCHAKADDWVNIEISDNNFLKAVLIMYGVPFIFMIFGFFVGFKGANIIGLTSYEEIIAFFVGVIFLALAFLFAKGMEKRLDKPKYTPIATEILS